jgi:hypothetical protein
MSLIIKEAVGQWEPPPTKAHRIAKSEHNLAAWLILFLMENVTVDVLPEFSRQT